jgi:hypothetical protein
MNRPYTSRPRNHTAWRTEPAHETVDGVQSTGLDDMIATRIYTVAINPTERRQKTEFIVEKVTSEHLQGVKPVLHLP